VAVDPDKSLYSCTGSLPLRISCSTDARQLKLQGVQFDQVIAVILGVITSPDSLFQNFGLLDGSNHYPPTGEIAAVTELRTRCADLTIFNGIHPNTRWSPDTFSGFMAGIEDPSIQTEYILRIMAHNQKTCNIITQKGRLGRAPLSARKGDMICLVPGGEVPLLLRPDVDGDKFTFAGECYVHGFMDGEGLVEARSRMDSSYDRTDTAWLHERCEGPLPFETREFCIR
jgi:hypothetical protein